MRNDGTAITRLGGAGDLDDVFPRWTAAGSQVVFSTFSGASGTPREDVWVVDADGSDRRRLTTATSAELAPDPKPR